MLVNEVPPGGAELGVTEIPGPDAAVRVAREIVPVFEVRPNAQFAAVIERRRRVLARTDVPEERLPHLEPLHAAGTELGK